MKREVWSFTITIIDELTAYRLAREYGVEAVNIEKVSYVNEHVEVTFRGVETNIGRLQSDLETGAV